MKPNRQYKLESKTFFDRVSRSTHGNTHNLHSYILNNVSINKEDVILDLGCGRGEFLEKLRLEPNNFELHGIDLSPQMIDLCNEKEIANSNFIVGDAEFLPYKDSSFDKIYCLNSFHHYPSPEKVVKEMKRVLKKDGTIIIGEVYVLPILRGLINLTLPLGKTGDYKMYSKGSLNKLFIEEGLINSSFKIIDPFLFISSYKIK